MKRKRADIETRRKMVDKRAAGAALTGFARMRLVQSAVARATSRVKACLRLHSRQVTESRHLLLPVMFLKKPRFGWRFRAITGELFFARSPRAGITLSSEGRALSARNEQRTPKPSNAPLESREHSGANTGLVTGSIRGPITGLGTGPITGVGSPVPADQVIDYVGYFETEKFLKKIASRLRVERSGSVAAY